MTLTPDSKSMYLAVSPKDDENGIFVFGDCSSGVRPAKGALVTLSENAGMDHPYGLAVYTNGDVYVSNQHTDNVMHFDSQGNPQPSPAGVPSSSPPGTFIQFDKSNSGVRSLAIANNHLFVADEDANAVQMYSLKGNLKSSVPANSPVGLFYDGTSNLMYYGSKDDNVVYSFSIASMLPMGKYTNANLSHPAGIVAYEDTLFVLSQDTNSLMSFNTTSGAFISTVIASLPDSPEQIMLSNC